MIGKERRCGRHMLPYWAIYIALAVRAPAGLTVCAAHSSFCKPPRVHYNVQTSGTRQSTRRTHWSKPELSSFRLQTQIFRASSGHFRTAQPGYCTTVKHLLLRFKKCHVYLVILKSRRTVKVANFPSAPCIIIPSPQSLNAGNKSGFKARYPHDAQLCRNKPARPSQSERDMVSKSSARFPSTQGIHRS